MTSEFFYYIELIILRIFVCFGTKSHVVLLAYFLL
jgi:hypothetical protein